MRGSHAIPNNQESYSLTFRIRNLEIVQFGILFSSVFIEIEFRIGANWRVIHAPSYAEEV